MRADLEEILEEEIYQNFHFVVSETPSSSVVIEF